MDNNNKMKKILIFGGNGFIGSYLAELLIKDYKITIVSQSNIQNQKKEFHYKVFQYTEKNLYEFLSNNNYDIIHFLSGNPHPNLSLIDPFVDIVQTINPSLSILKVLKKISFKGVLWFSSSVAVYGSSSDKFLKEDSECCPLSNYAVAKLTVENYAKHYAKNHNLKIGIYRIFSTYGPRLRRQVVYDNIIKIYNKIPEIILESSEETARDFSYVEDQALAIKFLNDNVSPVGDIYNIGNGKATKIIDVVRTIANIMNYKGNITCKENSKLLHNISWAADVNKIKNLGFQQKYSLNNGLQKTIKYITK